MRIKLAILLFFAVFIGYGQNATVNVNGQTWRYFVDYDSTLSTTSSWVRASDGKDRYKNNPAYPQATHVFNAENAVSGNIMNTQNDIIKHLHADGITGKGIKIGMIDYQFSEYTGLTFAGGKGSYLIDVPSSTYTQHGTTMSSIIGEKPNGYQGLVKPNGIVGIAYEALLYAVPYTDFVTEVQWFIDNKMDIINIPFSLGTNPALTAKIQEAIQKGIYVIVGAGNGTHTSLQPITYPASIRGVYAVTGRVGGHVFANDSGFVYGNVLASTATGVSKSPDFAVPVWAIGKDNAYNRGWTAHVGTSEGCSIMSAYTALMLDYYKSKYNIKLKPFQALKYFSKHTINASFFKYFQDFDFLAAGHENDAAPTYAALPPIVTPPAPSDTFVSITEFPEFKADLINLSSININDGGATVRSSTAFTDSDIGKILVVKDARSYPTYRKAPMTLTARITAVNAGDCSITILDGEGSILNAIEKTGWMATDNFDVLQKAIDTCNARGKPYLYLNYTGTAYVVPTLSARTRPAANVASLVVNNNLRIYGIDSGATKLKWGMEDIQRVGALNVHQQYCGFWLNSASLTLKNLSMLSADRTSTRNDHQNIYAIYGNIESNYGQNIRIENAAIRGNGYYSDSTVGTTIQGWGSVAYMNSPDPTSALDTCKMEAINSTIEGQSGFYLGSPKFFEPDNGTVVGTYNDTLNRLVRVWNSSFSSGAAYERKFPNVTMTAGNDTIKVSHPTFSWYDYNDHLITGSDERRLPVLGILRPKWVSKSTGQPADSMYWTKVKTIINDSMAVVVTVTDDNGLSIVTGGGEIPYRAVPWSTNSESSIYLMRATYRQAVFHSTYISGTVGYDAIGFTNRSLREAKNAQATCNEDGVPQHYCGSCINRFTGLIPISTFSEVGRQLKHILVGNTSGDYNDNPSGVYGSGTQKVW